MAVRIRFRKFYECDTEAERSLEFGLDSLIYCLDTLKYYKIEDGFYTEVPPDEIFFTSPVSLSKLQISGTPDGTKYLRDDGSWSTPDGSGGSGIPGGLTTQVQFNDGGVFGGDAGLTYDKTNNIIGLESIDFSTTHTATSAERRLNWDNDEGSLVLTLKGGNITIPLGQEIATLVYNAEATTLTKGEVVYAFGASGQRVSVKRARNLSDSTSAQTLGIVAETIASGTEGFVMVQGMIRGLNTIGYTQGNALYLSSTYGQFTNVKQSAPNHLVYLGFVVKVHATAGEIFVKCQNGYELDEIHDVQIVSKQNGDVISYDSVSGLWKNVQPSVGHTIQDNGTNETQRTNLNFQRMLVTDDAGNNATIVARPADTFVGITAPASPVEGDVWTNSETWKSYKYYDGFWVETSNINASAVSGTGTTNELAYFSGTSTIASLATGSYPSLTELSYVKGVTSAIQTQLNAKLSGTGTSGQVAYWSGTTTQTGSNNLFWDNTNARLGIGTNAPAVTLDTRGLASFTGTTASDGGQLGSELLSSSGWTSSGWTGSFGAGWTHTTGNTTALTNTLAAGVTSVYQIQYTITGRTLGTISIAFGGQTLSSISATGTQYINASTTGTVIITPTTDFDGTLIISIKLVSSGTAVVQLKNSSGTLVNEIRTSNSNRNTYIGINAGSKSLTSDFSVGIGTSALLSNVAGGTTVAIGFEALKNSTSINQTVAIGSGVLTNYRGGGFGVAIGWNSGLNNTSGGANVFIGYQSGLASTTTTFNVLIGHTAAASITSNNQITSIGNASGTNNNTGSLWTALGSDAARYYSGGTSAATSFSNGVYIGAITKVGAAAATNEVVIGYQAEGLGSNTTVIGNSSTTYGRWWGNLLVGTSTNAGYALDVSGTARVQVTGGSILFGNLAANYPAISFNGTLSSTDYNFGSGTTDKTFFINAPTGFNVSIRNNNSERLSVTGTNTIFYPVTGGSIILGGTSGSYSGLSFNGAMSSTDYNFLSQATDKTLFINVPTGYSHKFRVNNVDVIQIDSASITFSDAKNIILNTTTGTKIGTATTQKLGFFNATPVVQPSSVTTSQGIADALTSLGLLSSSSISTTPDVGGKLYLFNSY